MSKTLLDRLTYDNDRLYIDNRPIKTEKIIKLSIFGKIGAFIVSFFGITTPLILFIANYHSISQNVYAHEGLSFLRYFIDAPAPVIDENSQKEPPPEDPGPPPPEG